MELRSIEIVDVAKSRLHPERLHGRNVEAPKVGSQVDSDTIRVVGWVVGRSSPVSVVEIVHDGTILQKVPIDVERPGVAERFPEVPGARQSGFRTKVTIPASSEFDLVVRAILHDESRVQLGTIRAREPDGDEQREDHPEEQFVESSGQGKSGLTAFFRRLLGRGEA
jgi:hypothetical protein